MQYNDLLTTKRLPFREEYMGLLILNFCAKNQNKTAAEKNMKHVRFFFSVRFASFKGEITSYRVTET